MTSSAAPPLRIAGVPEAFNDPFATATFPSPVTFVPEPGGSGAMLKLLQTSSVDAALLLTECALSAAATGAPIRLLAPVVQSPLRWAAVVAAGSTPARLASATWAVSRPGSGSDVMLRVLAARRGWPPPASRPFGNFGGMAAAVRTGDAGAFLWETHTTRGLMRRGEAEGLELLEGVDAPWPAFSVAVRGDCERVSEVRAAIDAFLREAKSFQADADTPGKVSAKHGMAPDDAKEWVAGVKYAETGARFEEATLRAAFDAVVAAGVVPTETQFKLGEYIL